MQTHPPRRAPTVPLFQSFRGRCVMGHFRLRGGPFWMWLWAVLVLPWAVLVIPKICGPFWSGPFWFMGRFGRFPIHTRLSVCVSVCLFVCHRSYGRNSHSISMKLYTIDRNPKSKNPFVGGSKSDHSSVMGKS